MEGRHFLQASTILEVAGSLDLVSFTPVSHVLKTYESVMSFRMVSGVGLFCISKDTGATLASEFSVKYWFLRFVTVENLNRMSFRGWRHNSTKSVGDDSDGESLGKSKHWYPWQSGSGCAIFTIRLAASPQPSQ